MRQRGRRLCFLLKYVPVNKPLHPGGGAALWEPTIDSQRAVCVRPNSPGEEVRMKALGRHLVVEMWGCKANLNEPERIREALAEAVERARATNLGVHVHSFNPHGVSGVAVIAESHISIHTWPELGYVALDVFTCGDRAIPEAALEVLKDLFRPQHMDVLEIKRGLRPE